jgi:hypothetical protein
LMLVRAGGVRSNARVMRGAHGMRRAGGVIGRMCGLIVRRRRRNVAGT